MRRTWRLGSRGRGAILTALCLAIAGASPAFEVVVESVAIDMDEENEVLGYFDVHLSLEPGESMPPDIAGWQAAVVLDESPVGVAFETAEAPGEPHPPLLPGDDPLLDFDFDGNDSGFRASATTDYEAPQPFADGAGLFRVFFVVAPGTRGEFGVGLDLEAFSGTCISDADGACIDFVAVDGVLSVPEPAAALGCATAILCLSLLSRFKTERRRGA